MFNSPDYSCGYISSLIGLDLDAIGWPYQNWEHELADEAYVERILDVFPSLEDDVDDTRAAFAMLFSSYNEHEQSDKIEETILGIVKQHPERYRDILEYWALVSKYPLDQTEFPPTQSEEGDIIPPKLDWFSITELARDILKTTS
jgi:hypothetical protein